MSRLFDEITKPDSSGDILILVVKPDSETEHDVQNTLRLRCHSLILMQHPYFCKMLSMETPLREAREKEIVVYEPHEEFLALLRFLYKGNIDVNMDIVPTLLSLSDKYCIDEVVDICLKHLKDNFNADVFFTYNNFATLNSTYHQKLKDQLMDALKRRRNLCTVTEDPRWQEMPVSIVVEILSQDELPISSEAEVLTLMAQWIGNNPRSKEEVAQLLGALRMQRTAMVRVLDIDQIMQALGLDIFCSKSSRNGCGVWDPPFTVYRHEKQGHTPADIKQANPKTHVCHTLAAKDWMQQEPGWMYPGVHKGRITLTCVSWSHRERRLLRSSPTHAAALQKRAFDCGASKQPGGRERSPSPPPSYQVRMPTREAFVETFEIAQMSEASDAGILSGGVMRNLSQDKVDHEIVDHMIYCGVASGSQRHGVKVSQKEPNAIYVIEDLKGENSVNVGGTTSSVTFDLELKIGEASTCSISRCRIAVLRHQNTLLEEFFDVSSKMPLKFYFSSSYFDKNSSYSVALTWLRTSETDKSHHYYIGQ